jgi:hypothetical protein
MDRTTSSTIATSLIHSKIDYCNSQPSCYSNQSSSASSQLCCPCRHPNSTTSSYHSYSEISSLVFNKSKISIQSSVSHSQISEKTGHPSYVRSLLSYKPRRSTRSSSLITLNRPSITSGLKISNTSFYHFASVLINSLPSHLRHTVHHSTPESGIPELSTSVFLKKLKVHLFRIFFPP